MSIENYILGKFLGKGSYGEVNLAKSKIDKKWYVIKTIDLHNASKKERLFAQQEVDILSKLNHPNIVSYKESFQVGNGCLSIVMGYCEGGDLYTRLKEQAKLKKYLTETQVVEWFIQIAMALQYMHDQNILHRDLKTQNIFLSKTKIIKLGDLGIARVLDNNIDMATTMIGTPYYMSPELFSNKPYNAKSDIWALGCCVYEMATLKHAFNATDMSSLVYKILKGKLPLMPQHYSRDLQEIIKTMLMHNPSSRPSAARLLRHPFIKSHIVLFLEGSENRRRSDTKSRNIPVQNSSDSGFFGEPDLQPVATLSKVEIEIVEDKSKSHNLSDENQDPQDNRLSSDKDNISEAFQNKKLFAKNNISKNSKEQVLSKKCNNSEVPGDKLLPLHKNDISVDPKDNLIDLKEKKNPVEPSNNNRSNVNDQKNGKKLSMNENNNPAEVRKIISNRIKAKLQQKKDEEIKKFSTNEKDVKNCLQQDDSKNGPVNHLPYPNQCENSQGKNGERHLSRPLPPPPCDNFKSTEFDPNGPLRSNKVNEVNETKVFSQECRPNTEARKKRRQRQQEFVKPFVSDIRQVPKKLPFAKNKVVYPYDHPDGAKDISKNIDVILSSQHKVKELNEVVKSTEELNEVVKSTKELNEVVKSTEEFNEIVKSTEEASFIKTLQQTLKMENDFTEKISPEQSIEADFVVDCPTVTGRLVDRIARLRCECISILGEELLKLAYKVIDTTNNEEQVEAALISLMGRVKYDEVGAQVLQLKFCEEFTATS